MQANVADLFSQKTFISQSGFTLWYIIKLSVVLPFNLFFLYLFVFKVPRIIFSFFYILGNLVHERSNNYTAEREFKSRTDFFNDILRHLLTVIHPSFIYIVEKLLTWGVFIWALAWQFEKFFNISAIAFFGVASAYIFGIIYFANRLVWDFVCQTLLLVWLMLRNGSRIIVGSDPRIYRVIEVHAFYTRMIAEEDGMAERLMENGTSGAMASALRKIHSKSLTRIKKIQNSVLWESNLEIIVHRSRKPPKSIVSFHDIFCFGSFVHNNNNDTRKYDDEDSDDERSDDSDKEGEDDYSSDEGGRGGVNDKNDISSDEGDTDEDKGNSSEEDDDVNGKPKRITVKIK